MVLSLSQKVNETVDNDKFPDIKEAFDKLDKEDKGSLDAIKESLWFATSKETQEKTTETAIDVLKGADWKKLAQFIETSLQWDDGRYLSYQEMKGKKIRHLLTQAVVLREEKDLWTSGEDLLVWKDTKIAIKEIQKEMWLIEWEKDINKRADGFPWEVFWKLYADKLRHNVADVVIDVKAIEKSKEEAISWLSLSQGDDGFYRREWYEWSYVLTNDSVVFLGGKWPSGDKIGISKVYFDNIGKGEWNTIWSERNDSHPWVKWLWLKHGDINKGIYEREWYEGWYVLEWDYVYYMWGADSSGEVIDPQKYSIKDKKRSPLTHKEIKNIDALNAE